MATPIGNRDGEGFTRMMASRLTRLEMETERLMRVYRTSRLEMVAGLGSARHGGTPM